MNRSARRAGIGAAITSALVVAGLWATATNAPAQDGPPSGDPRAVGHYFENDQPPQSCADAGLDGTVVVLTVRYDNPKRHGWIEAVPAGYELTGIVVIAASAYNVYVPDARDALHAPPVGPVRPVIQRLFGCGVQEQETTTTTTTTLPPTTTTTTSESSTSETTAPTSDSETTAPPTTTTPGDDDLADTGADTGGLLVGGAALLLLGAGLLLATRRMAGRR